MYFHYTECVTDVDKQSEMIIFEHLLITFEATAIFGACINIGSSLQLSTKPLKPGILVCPSLWNTLYYQ